MSGFKTFAPDFGKTAREGTEVAMAYDDENLYFAFRCYESQTEKIKTSVSSRDNITSDDWVCLNLDSFGDQQALYAFYINPSGIQADSRFSAGNEDFSLDLVWFSAGRLDSLGYTIEMQLPLKSIRYTDHEPVKMAVFFERYVSRWQEHSSYPEFDGALGMAILTQTAPMLYSGVKHYTLFELLPAITYGQQYLPQRGGLIRDDPQRSVSLTTKYGITSDLILDGTYNPDFSQVESDADQVDVNLRYSLYYPEKRSFFLEGKEHFTLGATAMSSDETIDPVRTVIHTRTIVDPLLGAKLSGKIDEASTISVLYAMDQTFEADRSRLGEYAHVPVLRYKRALNQDSYVGGIYTGIEHWQGYNRVGGVDEQVRLPNGAMLESSGLFSSAKDGSGAAPLNGYTLGARYSVGSRDIDYEVMAREVSNDFRADMGYITRTGVTTIGGLFRPKWYPGSGPVQRFYTELYSAQTRDKFSGLWETNDHAVISALAGSMNLAFKYRYSTEVYQNKKFYTGGLIAQYRGQLTKSLFFSISYLRNRAIFYQTLTQGKSNRISFSAIFQPSANIQAEGSVVYSDFTRDDTGVRLYSYPIERLKLTFQPNKHLFFRGIGQYNDYWKELTTDLLASFTYIPGTVIFLGYGSVFDKLDWDGTRYRDGDHFTEMQRGYFFKTSYLWRL